MYSNNDKIYLQSKEMTILKEKISKAIDLSKELALTLQDLETYKLEFEIKKEETWLFLLNKFSLIC